MAEATLNDVSKTIREDGAKDREQLKGDSIRQFIQLRSSNKLLTSLTEILTSLTQAQIDSNELMKKQFEQQKETLARINAKEALGEPANDNDINSPGRLKRMMIGLVDSYNGVKKILNNIKKNMPNKATMFTLLFGGLAAAFAFFPKEVKEYLVNPLIDVINVFRDKEATTNLGLVVEKLKKGLGWIADNFGEKAAWIVGIGVAAKALQAFGLPTLGAGPAFGLALKAVGAFLTMPWVAGIVGIAALLATAKLGLDELRELSIESETELSKKALREYEKAVKDGNKDEIDRIVAQQSARLKRNQDTTLKGIESIEGPINEILKLNVKTAQMNKEIARQNKLAAAVESDTMGGASGSTDQAINDANNKIAESIKEQVLAITKGKAPNKDTEADIYKLLKESIELNDPKETKAVIRGIKDALPSRFSKLSTNLAFLNSRIKIGQNIDKMMENLNLALRGEKPTPLSPENLTVEPSKSQENLKNMYAGFDEMDNNMRRPIVPVVSPTTNNNDNKKTTNTYNIYNNYDNWMSKNPNMHYGTTLMF